MTGKIPSGEYRCVKQRHGWANAELGELVSVVNKDPELEDNGYIFDLYVNDDFLWGSEDFLEYFEPIHKEFNDKMEKLLE